MKNFRQFLTRSILLGLILATLFFQPVTISHAASLPIFNLALTSTSTGTATKTRTLTPTPTPPSSAPGLIFYSLAAQDGWVLESSEDSNVGGTLNSAATTLRVGDDNANRQYRTVLSFNTASLPDNAIITSVILQIKQQVVIGNWNPVTIFQGFMTDIKNGTFGTNTLQTSDFQTTAIKTLGPFKPNLLGGWYSINLTMGKAYINKLTTNSGLTQIRLRFKVDDNNNRSVNYLSLYSGNASNGKPMLAVAYTVPATVTPTVTPTRTNTPTITITGTNTLTETSTVTLTPSDTLTATPTSTPNYDPVFNPANGHWYQAVAFGGNWDAANAEAQTMSFLGMSGHLATITSQSEGDFIGSDLQHACTFRYWIGGYQDHNAPDYNEPSGGWQWVTDEAWSYTNWYGDEPNDSLVEDYLMLTNSACEWNDGQATDGSRPGFLIEYEPGSIPTDTATPSLTPSSTLTPTDTSTATATSSP